MVLISDLPLSLDAAYASLQDPTCGGITLFVGTVRNHNQGNSIQQLDFSSYVPMAEKELKHIMEGILAETDAKLLYAAHRVGALEIGDIAVIVGASAPHRDAAFIACRALIDRLKKTVPIWKKEIATDGSYWINAHP